MARTSTRTPEEIGQLLRSYERSGLSRRQYCEKQGIAVTTLDYYRRRQRKDKDKDKDKQPRAQQETAALVRVKLASSAPLAQPKHQGQPEGFTVVLAEGRRIEGMWNFNEQDLARLIRVLEAA